MTLQSSTDIPLQIVSENSGSERRITPSWTIAQLKTKLEPVTGIPPSSQRLTLRISKQQSTAIEADDEETVQLARFPLQPYAEIYVTDTRPASARQNLTDPSSVPKYTMPAEEYSARSDSVLAWKKAHKLGRFDPHAPSLEAQKRAAARREVEERGIQLNKRCRLNGEDVRRGLIRYIGEVPEIPHHTATSTKDDDGSTGSGSGGGFLWVGVELDEPMGKNDGSVAGKRYFECRGEKFGVFVRPERVEVGEWPVLSDLEELEEI